MKLNLDYNGLLGLALLETDDPSSRAWMAIVDLMLSIQDDALILEREIHVQWFTVLRSLPNLARIRKKHRLQTSYNHAASSLLKRYRKEHDTLLELTKNVASKLKEETVQAELENLGWGTRMLTDEQRRDVVKMVSLSNGANFSVPGAGKTTVALAVHLLTRSDNTKHFVVCPINAFSSWDDSYRECFYTDSVTEGDSPFVRLRGPSDNILSILQNPPNRMITNYETIPRILSELRTFLGRNNVHMVLDESHRIKSGFKSITGSTILSLSHLPERRDILTGTPIPRAIDDIGPQLDFLWPGHGIGKKAVESSSPGEDIRYLHVRTTKSELGLPPINRLNTVVSMSPAQAMLYGLLRSEMLRRWARVATRSEETFARANRCVIRLLQASSNPILVARALSNSSETNFLEDKTSSLVLSRVVAEGDSPKVKKACSIARDLVHNGQKVLIWTSFVYNVERITTLLTDLGATFIHGGTPSGSSSDMQTREGRISALNDASSNVRVLVANPAACGEGVSLHKECHYAIYVDRTYNAGHFLQSVDRIHRLGLPPDTETVINVLESAPPTGLGAIDYSVRRRTALKLRIMDNALNDKGLRKLALDEEDTEAPVDTGLNIEDLADLIEELESTPYPEEDDVVAP